MKLLNTTDKAFKSNIIIFYFAFFIFFMIVTCHLIIFHQILIFHYDYTVILSFCDIPLKIVGNEREVVKYNR